MVEGVEDRSVVIGIDCGGTNIKGALLQNGKILDSFVLPSTNQEEDLWKVVGQAIELCEKRNFPRSEILGIGLSLAGIIDYENATLLSSNGKYEWARDFDFRKWAADNFDLPLVVENDARLALLGEIRYGVGYGTKDAVLFMLGTGIGTSAVIDGKILRGVHFQGGILSGHLGADIHGLHCNCGGIGCLEAQVGTWNLPTFLQRREGFASSTLSGLQPLDYQNLFIAYKQKDPFAVEALEAIKQFWALGIVNLILAYDPSIVICTGGVFHSADEIIPYISEYVEKHAWTYWGNPEIVVAKDVSISALLGTEMLLREYLYGPLSNAF